MNIKRYLSPGVSGFSGQQKFSSNNNEIKNKIFQHIQKACVKLHIDKSINSGYPLSIENRSRWLSFKLQRILELSNRKDLIKDPSRKNLKEELAETAKHLFPHRDLLIAEIRDSSAELDVYTYIGKKLDEHEINQLFFMGLGGENNNIWNEYRQLGKQKKVDEGVNIVVNAWKESNDIWSQYTEKDAVDVVETNNNKYFLINFSQKVKGEPQKDYSRLLFSNPKTDILVNNREIMKEDLILGELFSQIAKNSIYDNSVDFLEQNLNEMLKG